MNDYPEVFGLHENADVTSAQQETYNMFETILLLQPRISTGKGKGRGDHLVDVANDILKRIPGVINTEGKFEGVSEHQDCMVTVLYQEIVRYNRYCSRLTELIS
jgi:dynein heavy chain